MRVAQPSVVFQLARFGDILQTGRLMASLPPGAVLVVDRGVAELARLAYPRVHVLDLPVHGKSPGAWSLVRSAVAALQALGPAEVYLLNYSGLSAALAAAFPAERLRAYGGVGGSLRVPPWFSLLIRWAQERRNGGLNLVDAWGLLARDPAAPAAVHSPAQPRGRTLGVVLAGQNPRRSLPAPVLAAWIGAALSRFGGTDVVLLGASGQERLAAELMAALPAALGRSTRNLVGRTGWRQLWEIVAGCGLVLSPDTGVAHMAARLGVPVLGAYLASAWVHETGPYGEGHVVVQSVLPCSPCLETAVCPTPGACLAPLAQRETIRWIARGEGELPSGVVALHSGMDALGVYYHPVAGEDPTEAGRQAFRSQVAALWGLGAPGRGGCTWMTEKDWVLPGGVGGQYA
ncbi:MAG: hypothetical protein JG774_604 [Desulfomicrobiaceae bacterium]|nr:hypothetical protein [Desulfomicrobiaceae bacterium]